MNRRRFLGAGGAGVAAGLAGCVSASLGSPTTIDWEGEEVDMDGRERHLLFGEGIVFSIRQLDSVEMDIERPTPIPITLVLYHPEGLRTDRLRVRLHAPPDDGSAFNAAVYLRSPPNNWWPQLSLAREQTGAIVITADDLAGNQSTPVNGPGAANVTLQVFVVPVPAHPVETLYVDLDANLSEPSLLRRKQYHVTRQAQFPLVTIGSAAQ